MTSVLATMAASAALSLAVPVADKDGVWQGLGSVSCQTFTGHRDQQLDNAYHWWLLGWAAAHNRLLPDTYTLVPDETAFRASLDWLDKFCRANPDHSLTEGAVALTDGWLYHRRLTVKPP